MMHLSKVYSDTREQKHRDGMQKKLSLYIYIILLCVFYICMYTYICKHMYTHTNTENTHKNTLFGLFSEIIVAQNAKLLCHKPYFSKVLERLKIIILEMTTYSEKENENYAWLYIWHLYSNSFNPTTVSKKYVLTSF